MAMCDLSLKARRYKCSYTAVESWPRKVKIRKMECSLSEEIALISALSAPFLLAWKPHDLWSML